VTPEGAVKLAVQDLLTAERIWWCRQNTGSIVLGQGKSRRCFTSGRAGMADILALPRLWRCDRCANLRRDGSRCACGGYRTAVVMPLWIECKRPRGGVHSLAQKEFQREVEAEGHIYLLVSDVRQVVQFLKETIGR